MENIFISFDRSLAALPLQRPSGLMGWGTEYLDIEFRLAGIGLAALSGWALHRLLGRAPSWRPEIAAAVITLSAASLAATYLLGWEGGDHDTTDSWDAAELQYSGPGRYSTFWRLRTDDMAIHAFSLRETVELSVRMATSGLLFTAMALCGHGLVQAVRQGDRLRMALTAGGLIVGLGHLALWQTTDGNLLSFPGSAD